MFNDLLCASRRHRRPVELEGCRTESSPSLKAGEPGDWQREETAVPAGPQQRERASPAFLCLFILFGPSTDWMIPTLGRAICFTQFTCLNAKPFPKHPHRHTQRESSASYLGILWSCRGDTQNQPSWLSSWFSPPSVHFASSQNANERAPTCFGVFKTKSTPACPCVAPGAASQATVQRYLKSAS